jgi:hemerythrin-like domain-containing protein
VDDLINILRQQHWEIRALCDALDRFCKSGIEEGEDIEKWMNEKNNVLFNLKNFKKILLSHLKLEDAELYPNLLSAKNKSIKETAEKYSDEMKLISKRTISFFETYAHLKVDELSQSRIFKLDLSTIITIIRRRIDLEEVELYPLYTKLKK